MFEEAFKDRHVWLSGATGFKGAWLAEWLLALGASITAYALPPPTTPSLFAQLDLAKRLEWQKADLRNKEAVRKSIHETQPDYVFHLGAQSLVRLSYREPIETYETNVMGTIHVLDALRDLKKNCAAVIVTTDKCYENREWPNGYREDDAMGGHDPYSSSKGMAELATAAYRRSFFKDAPVRIASARAGNVLGGGDWAQDRIVPDCISHLIKNQPIPVRNKTARRPWQHVLDPLSGYLWLAARLYRGDAGIDQGFNFGPTIQSNRTVLELVQEILHYWPGTWQDQPDPAAPHEATHLHLNTDKAFALLGWHPVWDFRETVSNTTMWYQNHFMGANDAEFSRQQLFEFMKAASGKGLPWANH